MRPKFLGRAKSGMCIINFFEPEGVLIKFTQRNANNIKSGIKTTNYAIYAGSADHALQVMNILPDMKVMQGMQRLQVTQLSVSLSAHSYSQVIQVILVLQYLQAMQDKQYIQVKLKNKIFILSKSSMSRRYGIP